MRKMSGIRKIDGMAMLLWLWIVVVTSIYVFRYRHIIESLMTILFRR